MVNTVWAILIPGAFNVWNMILGENVLSVYSKRTSEKRHAIDGANEIQHFFRIMLPVCKPIIAVLALWSFVGMWNSYFDAMIYLNDANLQPLQLVLRSILGTEYTTAGYDCGYPEYGRNGKSSRITEICDDCCIQFAAY